MHRYALCVGLLVMGADLARLAAATSPQEAIDTIRAVGREGEGNPAASRAWKQLATLPASALPRLLSAMDGANPLAVNWLVSAIETVADRTRREGGRLPLAELKQFLLNTRHDPGSRVLAFRLLAETDPEAAENLVPGLLNDPSVVLRRKSVARLLEEADALHAADKKVQALALYRKALDAARDIDQIEHVTGRLRESGESVDLPRHFGFLMHWQVIGPFHNNDRAGFEKVFPPEAEGYNPNADYEGKNGQVRWRPFVTTDPYGVVDINQALDSLKEVTAYAYTEFKAPEERQAQIRLGSKNAWKIWFNDEFVFGRDEYHRGKQIDQYSLPVRLREGVNTILVKVCQNEERESWTQEWDFQLRICDATGTAILSLDRPPTPSDQP